MPPIRSGAERTFGPDEIIVSKTDTAGRITYANDVFLTIAGYTEREIIGKPHSIIRHPDMPRCVFRLLWDTIRAGRECFAYVINRARNGDYYWVHAHVTPNTDAAGAVTGYHSNRRCPRREAVAAVEALYADLRAIETRHADPQAGIAAATGALNAKLEALGMPYHHFVFTL